ncbi:hypothetical protein RN001_013407 [Aquatica leii]|uniref:SET domain-containing protein n=1 Tax=Aquatica leii TaxID=1421715 RepID=A0AAN7P005_9COLE|nr:hypothetical protein RN001_013407 [Aquatica leii]
MSKNHKKKKSRSSKSRSQSIVSISNDEICKEPPSADNFRIKTSKIMGRYMVAARDFKPGAVILSETPLVVGPLTNCEVQCLGCYKILCENGKYYKCKSCSWPLCSPTCDGFKKPYGHSEKECQILTECKSGKLLDYRKFSSIAIHFNAIAPLRCLLLKTTNPCGYAALRTMEPHNDIRQTIPEVWDSNQTTVVNRIIKQWGLNVYSEEEIHTMCGILEVNAFEIGQNGINLRGLYPTAFLMSHNCVPNTNHVDEDCDYRLIVRASTEIGVEEPITLSYAYTLHGTMKRRDHLMDNKFFACKCSRCLDPTELGTYTSALRCPKCKTGLVLSTNPLNHEAEWACNNTSKQPNSRCPGYKVASNSLQLLIERISREAESLDCNDIKGMEAFLQKYRNVLHSNHYLCLGIKLSLSQLYGKANGYIINDLSPEILNRKKDICEEIMEVFDVIEPGFTRLRGVTLYELHAPIMMLTTKSYEQGTLTKTELRKRLKEVLRYLEEAALILGYEPESSSEHIMGVAAKDALQRIRDWEKIIGKLTPDEIKTRIRNLKCLYHRIKRSTASGTGVGTVDPDWPHFKAMDAILSKEGQKRVEHIDDGVLEGPRCEDIKQEMEIDINDDMESWVTNDSMGSENSEEPPPLPTLKPAPSIKPKLKEVENQIQPKQLPTVLPSFTIPQQNASKPGSVPSIPLPLLILNSLQPQHNIQDKNKANSSYIGNDGMQSDLHNVLKEILNVQKENLDIEKQKLEIEKQRLEFDRVVGSQLLTLVPMIGGIIQRLALNNHDIDSNTMKNRKRKASEDIFKDSKILRSVLEQGIRKYMLGEENEDLDEEKDSDNDDSGVQNEENSSSKE